MAMGHKEKNQYLGRPVKERDRAWGHGGQGQRRNREDLKGRETEARAPGKKEGVIAWPEDSLGGQWARDGTKEPDLSAHV